MVNRGWFFHRADRVEHQQGPNWLKLLMGDLSHGIYKPSITDGIIDGI